MRHLRITLLTLGLLGAYAAPTAAQGAEDAGALALDAQVAAPVSGDSTAPAEGMPAHTETAPSTETSSGSEAGAETPTEPVASGAETQTNPAEEDLPGFSKEVAQKFKDRDWLAAFAGLLMILIALLRKFAGRISGWFLTKRGGWALNFGSAFGLTLAIAMWTGVGWSWSLLPAAFGFGLAASGGYKALKDITAWLFNRDEDVADSTPEEKSEDAPTDPAA